MWAKAASPLRSFLSPMAVAMLFAAIGGWGLVGQHAIGLGASSSLLVAVPLGWLTAFGVVNATARLAGSSQSAGNEIHMAEFFGAEAEVITPIPAGGLGEVAAMVGGQRYAGPAREIEGRAVPRGAVVTVVEKTGATLVVTAGDADKEPAR
jgi:membrane-bound ClpP family serine protease